MQFSRQLYETEKNWTEKGELPMVASRYWKMQDPSLRKGDKRHDILRI